MSATYFWYLPHKNDLTGADHELQIVRKDNESVWFFGMEDAVERSTLQGKFIGPIVRPELKPNQSI